MIEVEIARDRTLELCRALRDEVFVRGQGVPRALEHDGRDDEASHWLARLEGEPAGTARMRIVDGRAKAERVAVRDRFRGAGVGAALMEAIESEARRRGLTEVVLDAQVPVVSFYERLGYTTTSGEFQEAGIPHRSMRKVLAGPAPEPR